MIQELTPEVLSFGEPLIGIYPPEGTSIEEDVPLTKTWGGDTSNFALALARLGHGAAYLTRVGDDPFGRSFVRLWKSRGVDTSLVQTDREHPTGLYFVSFQGGEHRMTYYRRASAACFFDTDLVEGSAFKRARVFHLSSLSQAISQKALEASFELLEKARNHGLLISYDVNFRPAVWPRLDLARAIVRQTIEEYADLLEATSEEMEVLGFGADPEKAISGLRRTPRLCAIKMGPRGAYLTSEGRSIYQPAFRVSVRDTVGAGDAFDAGLVAAVLEDMNLEEAGRLAAAAAACVCRETGPLRGQPTREQAEEFLAESPELES